LKPKVSICWFRRDLRLDDHAALFHGLNSAYPVLAVFVFDLDILNQLQDSQDKRVSFIHSTLNNLDSKLQHFGSSLFVCHATVTDAFAQLIARFDVKEVFANHDYEPYAIKRDARLRSFLASNDIQFHTYKDQVIFEGSEILKADGSPYTIFTPYSKRWKDRFTRSDFTPYPIEKYITNLFQTKPFPIPTLHNLGFIETDSGLSPLDLSEETITNYHNTRDFPGLRGTSHASTYLRFGTISIRRAAALASKWNETWLNELIWREFFMMILYHFPKVISESFKRKYDEIPWRNDEIEFKRWCRGETGYPLVDAGMRQLNQTGWMHNRVRMITASFLTKHLLIDWRWGEAYFAQKLLDYDLSSNNGNWQWAAGCGCDSAPYFRIFNPITQAKKFDPQQTYVKRWIPDIDTYKVAPVVEHEFARKRALSVYKTALSAG
jgi:deoxyribodipyrimidine photo-lyase